MDFTQRGRKTFEDSCDDSERIIDIILLAERAELVAKLSDAKLARVILGFVAGFLSGLIWRAWQ